MNIMSHDAFHSSADYKYAVVEFIEDNVEVTVAPVPLSWFDKETNYCVWPCNMSGVDILSRVQAGQPPDPGWPSFRGTILRECSKNYFVLLLFISTTNVLAHVFDPLSVSVLAHISLLAVSQFSKLHNFHIDKCTFTEVS